MLSSCIPPFTHCIHLSIWILEHDSCFKTLLTNCNICVSISQFNSFSFFSSWLTFSCFFTHLVIVCKTLWTLDAIGSLDFVGLFLRVLNVILEESWFNGGEVLSCQGSLGFLGAVLEQPLFQGKVSPALSMWPLSDFSWISHVFPTLVSQNLNTFQHSVTSEICIHLTHSWFLFSARFHGVSPYAHEVQWSANDSKEAA